MKRIAVSGADRDPSGAHHLSDDAIKSAGGVEIGERIVIFLVDEPLECDAVVQSFAGWEPHLFGREIGLWREPRP
ncbi:hypothetical protein KOAAANKH_02509 [Brevundimonas sp. NIBR10]|uniref:hypothetical protein n=1 Tax=Brevundimonas sp. NIBR10 TaxID=3015997 RepID=UPI0022F15B8A|nr:hypothetical protein [Brevundimonas sp. NIBR10]WGM47629.1 hypothetical protein KOAAANKH_02509 [Brevundimonas sp. NIBR10]